MDQGISAGFLISKHGKIAEYRLFSLRTEPENVIFKSFTCMNGYCKIEE